MKMCLVGCMDGFVGQRLAHRCEVELGHDSKIHHLYNLSPCSNGFSDQDNLGVLILK